MTNPTTEELVRRAASFDGADLCRAAREELGLSRHELADLLQVARSAVKKWELGLRPIPRQVAILLRIILVLPKHMAALLSMLVEADEPAGE